MTLTVEAQEIIAGLRDDGFEYSQIASAMEDGNYLSVNGISQELAEEIHDFCNGQ